MSKRMLALIFGFVSSMLVIAVITAAVNVAARIAVRFERIGPELPATARFMIQITQQVQYHFYLICVIVTVICFLGAWIIVSLYKKGQPD